MYGYYMTTAGHLPNRFDETTVGPNESIFVHRNVGNRVWITKDDDPSVVGFIPMSILSISSKTVDELEKSFDGLFNCEDNSQAATYSELQTASISAASESMATINPEEGINDKSCEPCSKIVNHENQNDVGVETPPAPEQNDADNDADNILHSEGPSMNGSGRVLLSQSADYTGQQDSETDDHDELMMLKRRREDSPEAGPGVAKKKLKGDHGSMANADSENDLYKEYHADASFVRIIKSTRQSKTMVNAKSYIVDIKHHENIYRLNQGDVSRDGTVKFLCSKRKAEKHCKGAATLVLKKMNFMDKTHNEKTKRYKYFITKDLSLEDKDVIIMSLVAHTCIHKTPGKELEDKLTQAGLELVESQKNNSLTNRVVFPSEIVHQALRIVKQNSTESEKKAIEESVDKVDSRRVADRITRALRANDPLDPAINIENRETFDSYPLEFFQGKFFFDRQMAIDSKNESWLFVNTAALAKMNNVDKGICIQDSTFTFGKKPKKWDFRHFKHCWKMRYDNELVAFCAMSRATAASYTNIFRRMRHLNGGNQLKAKFLVMDREKALMKAAGDGEFLSAYEKYCAFHSIKLYLTKWRTNGLQKFICNFKTDDKSIFINKAFQLARSTPYIPIFVSRALIQYTLGLCQTPNVQQILGERDVLILSELLEHLDDDLNRNGDNICWFEMQVESEKWLDCTSNSIERRSGCHDFFIEFMT